MKTILTDFDGVVANSEWARAMGWYLAARIVNGTAKQGIVDDVQYYQKGDLSKHESENPELFSAIRKLAGKSTEDTLEGVWALTDKKESKEYLSAVRNDMKTSLLERFTDPIDDSIDFFVELKKHDIKLGLVTQTEYGMVEKILKTHGFESCLDGARSIFDIGPLKTIFDTIECCGDKFYDGVKGIDKKSVGYAIACKSLNIDPKETFCIEDSESGIVSASKIGLTAVGYKPKGSFQNLSDAEIIVSELDTFANCKCAEFIKENPLEKVIEFMYVQSQKKNKWVEIKKKLVQAQTADPRSYEYVRNLDCVQDTWDADPEIEDAVAENCTFTGKAYTFFRRSIIAAIADNLNADEIPLSIHIYGGSDKVEHRVTLKVKVGAQEHDVELYNKYESYGPPTTVDISGRLKDYYGWR